MAPDTGSAIGENSNAFAHPGRHFARRSAAALTEATAGADGDVRRFLPVEAKLTAEKITATSPRTIGSASRPPRREKMPSFHVQ
jgi:hypothetical protein